MTDITSSAFSKLNKASPTASEVDKLTKYIQYRSNDISYDKAHELAQHIFTLDKKPTWLKAILKK
jgi:hypothetical protein